MDRHSFRQLGPYGGTPIGVGTLWLIGVLAPAFLERVS